MGRWMDGWMDGWMDEKIRRWLKEREDGKEKGIVGSDVIRKTEEHCHFYI